MSAAVAAAVSNVVKDYVEGFRRSRIRALDHLSFEVPRGSVFGVLGRNGAGKSTTFHVLMDFIRPTSGTAMLLGRPVSDPLARRSVGFLPETFSFDGFATGTTLLHRFDVAAGHPLEGRAARVRDALRQVGLESAAHRRVGGYSKGMLQRIGLAQALLGDPELVVLDEPMSGMDPAQRLTTKEVLHRRREQGLTTIFSSHILSDIEDIVDRLLVLDRGRVVLDDAVEGLCRQGTSLTVLLRRANAHLIASWPSLNSKLRPNGDVEIVVPTDHLEAFLSHAIGAGAKILEVRHARRSIEEVFLGLTGGVP